MKLPKFTQEQMLFAVGAIAFWYFFLKKPKPPQDKSGFDKADPLTITDNSKPSTQNKAVYKNLAASVAEAFVGTHAFGGGSQEAVMDKLLELNQADLLLVAAAWLDLPENKKEYATMKEQIAQEWYNPLYNSTAASKRDQIVDKLSKLTA